MNIEGGNPDPRIEGLGETPAKSNYFIGNDPQRWRANVPNFEKVRYAGVYAGVDLIFYGNQRQLEYDFVVSPGADPRAIVLKFEGAQKLRVDKDGDLLISVKEGEVTQRRPYIYQVIGEQKRRVDGGYRLVGKKRIAFELGQYDVTRPLIIDPVLSYSTYLGGIGSSVYDFGRSIAVDAAGNAYVTGSTDSPDFPVLNAFQPTHGSDEDDAFVTKLSAGGRTLVYSTYLGGNGLNGEQGYGIAVDAAGNAYVAGYTGSDTFPTTAGAYDRTLAGSIDAFVTKLDPSGSSLVYSTYLGGFDSDYGHGIAVDAAGVAYVTGLTRGFPTVNPVQPARGGSSDAFVAKLNPAGAQLLYSTYLGGSGDEAGNGIAIDAAGSMYVVGYTSSANFPARNAFQSSKGDPSTNDAFITKLNPDGSEFIYSTYLGGSGHDAGYGIAVDSASNVYVTGETTSPNFPTFNAFQPSVAGNIWNAFVTKLDAAGSTLAYSTYLGGSNVDSGRGIAVDAAGSAYVTGSTVSPDFPTVNPLRSYAGDDDVFVSKFDAAGNTLSFSTHVGGAQEDKGLGIALDSTGNVYVTGMTQSWGFPTANAFQSSLRGSTDAFVFRISGFVGYDIRGRVTDASGAGMSNVTLTLSGTRSATTQTDANGDYSFVTLESGGNFTITPSKSPFVFTPASQTFNNLTTEQRADFTVVTHSISGRVTDAAGAGAGNFVLSLGGAQSGVALTDGNGNYTFPRVAAGGSYTVTPSKSDYALTYSFTPPAANFGGLNANAVGNFSFTTSTNVTLHPVADAYVQDGTTANTNYGNVTPLQLRTDRRADNGLNRDVYLKFDLGGVTRSISSVKLRVHAALSEAGSVGTAAYSVADTTWAESGPGGITWNNKPARSAAPLAGASATITSTSYATYELDVTSYVKSEKAAGRDLISLALHDPSSVTPNVTLHSREAATNKPQLFVTTSGGGNSAPSVSLTGPADGASFAAPANVTLTANASDPDGGVRKVEFYAGTFLLGTATAAPYTLTKPFDAGSYSLTAVATDDAGAATVSAPVSINVNPPNAPPAVSLTAPAADTTFPAGANVALSAAASDPDGGVSKVEFFADATLVGTATASPYGVVWNNAPPGAHTLTARATDNAGGATTSGPVQVNVVWQTGLLPTADAYVSSSAATTNFGTAAELQTLANSREAYLKFDLTAVSNIAHAKLRLHGRLSDATGTNVPVAVYPVSLTPTNWTESGSGSITWNNKPPAGATALATTTVANNVARWHELDLTAYVKQEKAAGRNVVSFAVKNTAASTPYVTFDSREATGATTNRPQLVITTTSARSALLVTASTTLNSSETAVRTRLQNLGFAVTVKAAGTNTNAVRPTDADGKSLVVVSSTVVPANVTSVFRYVAVPVVNWEFDILDDMGMTGTVSGTDYGTATGQTQLAISNASHPLAAGLSGTVSVAGAAGGFTWGKPNANAAKAATLAGDATRAALFGYDGGATMPGLAAPARRVALFLTDTTAAGLTANGWSLFDAAVRWAAAPRVAPTVTGLTPTAGTVGTAVTLAGYNFGDTRGDSAVTFNGVAAGVTSWGGTAVVVSVPPGASTGPVTVTVGGLTSNGLTFTVESPPADTDNDGLPDAWEMQHFGNLAQTANGDPDGDGLTNLQEFQQGRSPTKTAQPDDGSGVNLKVHTPLIPPGQ